MTTPFDHARATAEQVARASYGKLVAWLAARSGDVAGAEDALSEAFAAALESWPAQGVPDNPDAWLLTVARRKQIDAARRQRTGEAAANEVRLRVEELTESDIDDAIPDHRLRLMFACAHPGIDAALRAPLMLQTVLGLDAAAIASAFLVAPAAMAQRLVRAKSKIRLARIPLRMPEADEIADRLDAVLAAIYAAYAEGWSDPTGAVPAQRALAEESLWLSRLAVSLMPDAPEAAGLLALMLYTEARRKARRDAAGDFVPLADQDTTLWDAGLIDEADALLRRASAGGPTGRYQIEAAIQSAHTVRRITGVADWPAIVQLYDLLLAMTGSPVVAVNRAVACAETDGPAAALAELDRLAADQRLATYQPYWAARASLLARIGAMTAARGAYTRAIGLEADPAVRRFLLRRQGDLEPT